MTQGKAFSCKGDEECSGFAVAAQVLGQAVKAGSRQSDWELASVTDLLATGGQFLQGQGESGVALRTLKADRQFHGQLPYNLTLSKGRKHIFTEISALGNS
jgi:hypothetical protein